MARPVLVLVPFGLKLDLVRNVRARRSNYGVQINIYVNKQLIGPSDNKVSLAEWFALCPSKMRLRVQNMWKSIF